MFLMDTPTWIIFIPFFLMCVAAYLCAWIYRDTYDFKKSLRLYFPAAIVITVVFWFVGLPFVLGGFMVFSGFVISMFASNKFFNK